MPLLTKPQSRPTTNPDNKSLTTNLLISLVDECLGDLAFFEKLVRLARAKFSIQAWTSSLL